MAETARVIDITEDIKSDSTVVAVKQETGNVPAVIAVTDYDSCELANVRVLEDNKQVKIIHDKLDDKKARARQVWQDWNDLINELCAPWETDKAYHVDQVKKYRAEQKRIQEAEEARLREIARKEEEDRRLVEAAELEAEGRADEADEILEAPVTYVAPVVHIETPKVDNRMYRTQIKVRVKNRIVFLTSVRPEVLIDCLNEAAWSTIESGLSRKAKALGRAFSQPGCELTEQ
jgi:hypothetical protein